MRGIEYIPAPKALPPGMVVPFPFSTPPSGWLLLDGSTYNYNDYPALGALYGATPGGTFNVHDYRDRVLSGASATNVLDSVAGADQADLSHTHNEGTLSTDTVSDHTHGSGTLGADSVGDHNHTVDPPNTTSTQTGSQAVGVIGLTGIATPPNVTVDVDIPQFNTGNAGAHGHSVSGDTGAAGSHGHIITGDTGAALSAAQDMRQSTIYTNWIIKT